MEYSVQVDLVSLKVTFFFRDMEHLATFNKMFTDTLGKYSTRQYIDDGESCQIQQSINYELCEKPNLKNT